MPTPTLEIPRLSQSEVDQQFRSITAHPAAVPRETPSVRTETQEEDYWQSTETRRRLGREMLRGALGQERAGQIMTEVVADFDTAVQENLATLRGINSEDNALGEVLEFDAERRLPIRDGKVCTEDGRPMIDLVSHGAQKSAELALIDSRYKTQAYRDLNDKIMTPYIDQLQTGESMTLVSMAPMKAMARDGVDFWENVMHYRKDMAVIQHHYRLDENTLLTWSYSVRGSEINAFRKVMAARGTVIPAHTSHDDFMRYPIIQQQVSAEQARSFPKQLRKEFREATGQSGQYFSTTELLKANQALRDRYINSYIIPIARANASGINEPILQEFCRSVLRTNSKVSGSVRTQLEKISTSSEFSAADDRLVEGLVRYALVEELRLIMLKTIQMHAGSSMPAGQVVYATFAPGYLAQMTAAEMHQRMGGNIGKGIESGRVYGGCSGAGVAGRGGSPQEAYGGRSDGSIEEPQDQYGSLVFHCPKGCRNERKPGKLIERCQKCKISVRCDDKPPKDEAKARRNANVWSLAGLIQDMPDAASAKTRKKEWQAKSKPAELGKTAVMQSAQRAGSQ